MHTERVKGQTKIAAKYKTFYSENENGMCTIVPDRANKICRRNSFFTNINYMVFKIHPILYYKTKIFDFFHFFYNFIINLHI